MKILAERNYPNMQMYDILGDCIAEELEKKITLHICNYEYKKC